jgi:hypothetical protein
MADMENGELENGELETGELETGELETKEMKEEPTLIIPSRVNNDERIRIMGITTKLGLNPDGSTPTSMNAAHEYARQFNYHTEHACYANYNDAATNYTGYSIPEIILMVERCILLRRIKMYIFKLFYLYIIYRKLKRNIDNRECLNMLEDLVLRYTPEDNIVMIRAYNTFFIENLDKALLHAPARQVYNNIRNRDFMEIARTAENTHIPSIQKFELLHNFLNTRLNSNPSQANSVQIRYDIGSSRFVIDGDIQVTKYLPKEFSINSGIIHPEIAYENDIVWITNKIYELVDQREYIRSIPEARMRETASVIQTRVNTNNKAKANEIARKNEARRRFIQTVSNKNTIKPSSSSSAASLLGSILGPPRGLLGSKPVSKPTIPLPQGASKPRSNRRGGGTRRPKRRHSKSKQTHKRKNRLRKTRKN